MNRTCTAAFAALAALALCPEAARAEPRGPRGTYHWSGDIEGKFDEGQISLVPATPDPNAFAASAREKRRRETTEWRGDARRDGTVVTILRRFTTGVGVVGALEDRDVLPTPSHEYVAVFDEAFERATVRAYRVHPDGRREEIGKGRLKDRLHFWEKLPGELLGLARKEVDRAIHKEIDLSKEFHLLSYAHFGVRVAAELLEDGERTPLMKESDRAFRAAGKGEPIWIRSTVEGGPRIAFSTSVPIDPEGIVRLDAGFQLGAKIRYICDDQHARPASVTDARGALNLIEDVPARAFNLPITAGRAAELPVGTRRTLDGYGALAISGGVSFGHRLQELGVLEDRAEVGVYGGFGVHWNVRGDLRVEVERDRDQLVRVRWTKSNEKGLGANVHALLGLYVSEELLAKVPGPADKVVEAVVKEGQRYTTIKFNAGADWLKKKELVIEALFDLADPKARAAYEDAVRGNLVTAQDMAASGSPGGLKDLVITSTLTDALSFHAQFKAFRVLNASTERRTRTVHIEVESLDGSRSTTDVFGYERTGRGLFGDERRLHAEAIGREVVRAEGAVERGRLVTFTFTDEDDHAWKDEFVADLQLAKRLFGAGSVDGEIERMRAHEPGFLRHYGKTRMSLEVALGDRAIERILKASDAELLAAYGSAHWEESYSWTPERVKFLDTVSLHMPGRDEPVSAEKEALRLEAWAWYDAKRVLKLLGEVRREGASANARLEAFRKIAKKDGFKLRAVVALALVAGQDDAKVKWSFQGWGLNLAREAGQVSALPVHR